MSGIEVLRRLRRAGLQMPIAMLTTSMEEQDVIASLQSGAQGYLLKDMEPDELIAALQHHRERRDGGGQRAHRGAGAGGTRGIRAPGQGRDLASPSSPRGSGRSSAIWRRVRATR